MSYAKVSRVGAWWTAGLSEVRVQRKSSRPAPTSSMCKVREDYPELVSYSTWASFRIGLSLDNTIDHPDFSPAYLYDANVGVPEH